MNLAPHASALATHGRADENTHDRFADLDGLHANQVHGHAYSAPSEHSPQLGRSVTASCFRQTSQVPNGQGSRNRDSGTGDRRLSPLGSPDHSRVPMTSDVLPRGFDGRGEISRIHRHPSFRSTPSTSASYGPAQRSAVLLSDGSVHRWFLSVASARNASCSNRVSGFFGHSPQLNISPDQSKA